MGPAPNQTTMSTTVTVVSSTVESVLVSTGPKGGYLASDDATIAASQIISTCTTSVTPSKPPPLHSTALMDTPEVTSVVKPKRPSSSRKLHRNPKSLDRIMEIPVSVCTSCNSNDNAVHCKCPRSGAACATSSGPCGCPRGVLEAELESSETPLTTGQKPSVPRIVEIPTTCARSKSASGSRKSSSVRGGGADVSSAFTSMTTSLCAPTSLLPTSRSTGEMSVCSNAATDASGISSSGEKKSLPSSVSPTTTHAHTANTVQSGRNLLLEEDNNPLVPGFHVRAATLDASIDYLIKCFSAAGGLEDDENRFASLFLLMHEWFVTSERLARGLCDQYSMAATQYRCGGACPHTIEQGAACRVYQHRARVCQVFRYWLRRFPLHFDIKETNDSRSATYMLRSFQTRLKREGHTFLADLVDLSKIPKRDWARNISIRQPLTKHTRKVSLVFDHLEPKELAEHLTYLEHKVMRRIKFLDFKQYAEQGSLEDNPRLERSISQFNGLSQWTQFMVLSQPTAAQRAAVIEKFVGVAKYLLELQNFSSLMAVVGGLSHSALARLTHTTACLQTDTRKTLTQLCTLLSSSGNFSNYRKALAECKGFRIPILGVHMKDLISVHVALPDTVGSNPHLINLRKMAQLSQIFQELWELQYALPPLDVSEDLVNTLKLSLDPVYTEDEIFEMSLQREPKAPLVSAVAKSNVSAAEVTSRMLDGSDLETVHKHIGNIVEEVFHQYDTDRCGSLMRAHLDDVLQRFPALQSLFATNSDIAKQTSFTRNDLHGLLLHSNWFVFKHDFHETTYFRPTFCGRCSGLLWGLIKQGYKCKKCGINAHKHCRELLLAECRPAPPYRSSSFSTSDTTSTPLPIGTAATGSLTGGTPRLRLYGHPASQRRFKQSRSESESAPLLRRSTETTVWRSEDGDQKCATNNGSLGGGAIVGNETTTTNPTSSSTNPTSGSINPTSGSNNPTSGSTNPTSGSATFNTSGGATSS